MNSKIALVGPNGSGKSTIVKLITGEIIPSSGSVEINSQAKIGYYNQHFESGLPIDKTPIDYLIDITIYQYNNILKVRIII